jgi:hypothetical protein
LLPLVCGNLYQLNFDPKEDQLAGESRQEQAASIAEEIVNELTPTIFSLGNTCLNSSFLQGLITNPVYLMGQFDDLLIKLIFNAETQFRSSFNNKQDIKHNFQALLFKVKKDKRQSTAPASFNQVGIHWFLHCLSEIESSVKSRLESTLSLSEEATAAQFKQLLLDDHLKCSFSAIQELKYFPRTKFLCFQILSPWKLAAITDIINSKNQLKRGSFNKVNPNQSLLAQLPQDSTRTHFLA